MGTDIDSYIQKKIQDLKNKGNSSCLGDDSYISNENGNLKR